MGTCSRGSEDVSAVLGRPPNGGLSMTTLKVPGSVVAEVTVWSSTVENECERAWAIGRALEVCSACCLASYSVIRSSGSGGVGSERGVLEPYRLCSHSLLKGRSFESSVALSGGVVGPAGGKTNGSGCGRLRWFPGRTTGLAVGLATATTAISSL
jgi:hypothetical protein